MWPEYKAIDYICVTIEIKWLWSKFLHRLTCSYVVTNLNFFLIIQFYHDDSFGLRTLDEQGKVKIYDVPGVKHADWGRRSDIFDKYMKPWLN